ncbi:CheR family methyltransferase [Rhodopila globiformis]|nr:CheR family methyltransferase [Rhodopila globiformis]
MSEISQVLYCFEIDVVLCAFSCTPRFHVPSKDNTVMTEELWRPASVVLFAPRDQVTARGPAEHSADFAVVAIGASAGGLDACKKLLAALPPKPGMAFILVQHLDPTHDSMLVELLSSQTSMLVAQAMEGTPVEPDHLYIIPPGTYLSVVSGCLHLSHPQALHGARLPFDFLLHSLAAEYRDRSAGIILSGTGSDGSVGLAAVKKAGGLVIAQDPAEAGYAGMPESAILASVVDHVLPIADMPDALARYADTGSLRQQTQAQDTPKDWLPGVIELLRGRTSHDFTLYKPGTLQRQIERRMAVAAIDVHDIERYMQLLLSDQAELNTLAKELLINVTGFFRDQHVFTLLADKIIPDLVSAHPQGQPIRIWIAGCSTGEEAYSLAMLFREAISAANRDIKLQVFASDIDPDAVASAREGRYPETIQTDVSKERLARFFSKEDKQYRISAELRSAVVFTVQDLLADPPFSHIDFVSCRNLLIYLQAEAREKVLALFHFALRQGGVLLLGTSETVGSDDGRFEPISKTARLYRHIGHCRPGEIGFIRGAIDGLRAPVRHVQDQTISRQAALAELCRRLVIDTYAPAAMLINRSHECLYSLGPTDRYLRVVSGHPTQDLLALVQPAIRTKVRSAIQQATQANARIVIAGGRTSQDDSGRTFSIAVQPARTNGEDLLLVCFVDDLKAERARQRSGSGGDTTRVTELEQELEATRIELQGAVHNLEISAEEQKVIHEEALSVQEEYQSTNEELLTSKEELQSLNEELTALNSQLQETLERQRTTANDLQNVLYSTNVATLFLDLDLSIRFFTPTTRALFTILPGDIGRPLSDLHSWVITEGDLSADARTVLRTLNPIDREIETENGACYLRRVLPYRAQNGGVEGVVITFSDMTERRRVTDELGIAKRHAEQANAAKSRFLAAASHDLRQPLQTLVLLQGLLGKHVQTERGQVLIGRLDETLSAMEGMLNALLDINQIESGTVSAEKICFPVNSLLEQLRDEFNYHAQAKGLRLRVVLCGLSIESDPRLLAQMIRNLVSNALKYTRHGAILLGCRRHAGKLRIEVWDTGIGIADGDLQAIFDEYHQIDNPARERSRGLGLGLSIVYRLGKLLGHEVGVRSQPGRGSVFTVEVGLASGAPTALTTEQAATAEENATEPARHTGEILLIEDDPDVRDLLEVFLREDGYDVATAPDGPTALTMLKTGAMRPDLILADYNLPGGLNGVQTTEKIRELLHRAIPVIILTGDILLGSVRDIALPDCIRLTKPVKLAGLTQTVQHLLPRSQTMAEPRAACAAEAVDPPSPPMVFVVDDDAGVRAAIRAALEDDGRAVTDFASCEAFLETFRPGHEGCLVIDAYLPGMSGLELLKQLHNLGHTLPAIMITGNSDVSVAVAAMKAGAMDFIEKPISRSELQASVDCALEQSHDTSKLSARREDAAHHVAGLTPRQRQVMDLVLAGHPSKNISADLGISQRTVENHRAAIMKRLGVKSLPALARVALAATGADS